MIWLWIGLGLLLLLLGSYLVFCGACVRGKERPWTDHEAMEKRVGRSYAALIRSGVEWIERQNPRDVYLTSADGLRLHARWIPHAHAQGTMILFHGWRSSIVGDFSPSLPEYYARGYNLLLVDQRAHNGSQGKYITLGIRESRDVPDWVALHNQTFGPYPVILGGVSMGATTVLMAAGRKLPDNVRGVIADCGFTSPWEIMAAVGRARAHLPAFPLLYLVRVWCRCLGKFDPQAYSTRQAMAGCSLPVFFAHGQADSFVPCWMSQAAYDAAHCPKTLLLVPGAEHGRSFLVDRERYLSMVDNFLRQCIVKAESEVN